MNVDTVYLYKLDIPFQFDFQHAQIKRFSSDSLIVQVQAGEVSGYGEAVIRDYVTGNMTDLISAANQFAQKCRVVNIEELDPLSLNSVIDGKIEELPLICGFETAMLDLMCRYQKCDIYSLLKTEPLRQELTYGGIVPLLPAAAATRLLHQYQDSGITSLRIKVGNDLAQNRMMLSTARKILGEHYDLRVDANGAWNAKEWRENMALLDLFGISMVEEPFRWNGHSTKNLKNDDTLGRFIFVADESALTIDDLSTIKQKNTFKMVNIRLSKNGGLLRALKIAQKADTLGIRYQLGCHVGETGVLSALGRVAASLMRSPIYVDGSYDRFLLTDNITQKDITFGKAGKAPILRNNGLGFKIDESKLQTLSYEKHECI